MLYARAYPHSPNPQSPLTDTQDRITACTHSFSCNMIMDAASWSCSSRFWPLSIRNIRVKIPMYAALVLKCRGGFFKHPGPYPPHGKALQDRSPNLSKSKHKWRIHLANGGVCSAWLIMLRPRVMAGCAAHLSSVKSSDSEVQWGSLCAIVRGAVRKPVLTTTHFCNSQFRSFDY